MDGNPVPKTKKYKGELYSETRYAIIQWLERELPLISGRVIDIGAGNWKIPRQLMDKSKVKEYKTFDKKVYGSSKNIVDHYGDIQDMPKEWSNQWDTVLCLEVMECVPNPFKAMEEMHRILKPGGMLLLSSPFNYRWFGSGSWDDPKQNAKDVRDYWRITKQGLELLAKDFVKVEVVGFGGTGNHDRYVNCMKAIR